MKKICLALFLFLPLAFSLIAQTNPETDNRIVEETFEKAELLEKAGKLREAERAWRELTERFPERAGLWFFLGDNLKKQRKTNEAIEAFRRSLGIDPNWHASVRGLGLTYLQQTEDFDSAVLYLKKDYELHLADFKSRNLPTDRGFYASNLAEALFQAKRFEEARVIFEELLSRGGNRDYYKIRLAVCYLELDRLTDAENIIQPIMDASPTNYRIWKIYADILKAQNRTAEAEAAFQKYKSLCRKCEDK